MKMDAADATLVAGRSVFSRKDGDNVYAIVCLSRKRRARVHRLLLPNAERVDHANGDGLDNRRANLRPCTQGQNLGNARRRKSAGFKGVYREGSAWRVVCAQTRVGRFVTERGAARAYDRAARKRWGAFAALNFPEVGERSALTGEVRQPDLAPAVRAVALDASEQSRPSAGAPL